MHIRNKYKEQIQKHDETGQYCVQNQLSKLGADYFM